jgi:hypothetical protein
VQSSWRSGFEQVQGPLIGSGGHRGRGQVDKVWGACAWALLKTSVSSVKQEARPSLIVQRGWGGVLKI